MVGHEHFASVSNGRDAIACSEMLKTYLMFFPCQPFQSFDRLIGSGSVLPSIRFRNIFFFHAN